MTDYIHTVAVELTAPDLNDPEQLDTFRSSIIDRLQRGETITLFDGEQVFDRKYTAEELDRRHPHAIRSLLVAMLGHGDSRFIIPQLKMTIEAIADEIIENLKEAQDAKKQNRYAA